MGLVCRGSIVLTNISTFWKKWLTKVDNLDLIKQYVHRKGTFIGAGGAGNYMLEATFTGANDDGWKEGGVFKHER